MYKKAASNTHYLDRTGSHATKPKHRLPGSYFSADEVENRVSVLSLKEAMDLRQELITRVARLQGQCTAAKQRGDEYKTIKYFGVQIAICNLNITVLKRHIHTLNSVAHRHSESQLWQKAAEEVCGYTLAAQVAARKAEIERDMCGLTLA